MYNIILPVVYKDYSFLKLTIRSLCKHLKPKKIFIITDIRMSRYLPNDIKDNTLCEVIDENRLLEGLTYQAVDGILKSQGRKYSKAGWYFQQFLKMGFALSSYCDEDYYLSWDADTILLKNIDFFDETGLPFFTMKTEYHKPYFDSLEKLLNIKKTNTKSYIAEHMMFNRGIMMELIEAINKSNVSGNTWYEKILNSIVPETISANAFSEFETYGSYCKVHHPNKYKERQLPSFRKAALIQGRLVSDRILNELSQDVCIASFEIYERPPFPWGVICSCYEKITNYKALIIRKFIK